MSQNDILNIKKKAITIQKLLKITFYGIIVIYLATLVITIILSLASQASFSAVRGNDNWSVGYAISNSTGFCILIPFTIIQPSNPFEFSAKAAFITYLVSALLFRLPIIIYALKQLLDIATSIINGATPFILENAERLKRFGYSIIAYSIAVELLFNILCNIFVIKIFSINISNMFQIYGILVGILILIISGIFRYGIYLQDEYDATL